MVSDVAQKYEQATTEEDVMLKVGGEATVYRGVEMKMRCPVNKRYFTTVLQNIMHIRTVEHLENMHPKGEINLIPPHPTTTNNLTNYYLQYNYVINNYTNLA